MPGAAIVASGNAAEVFDFLEEAFDEKKQSASLGIAVERVMTDNGSCYRSKAFHKVCAALGLRHIFTKPYTPRTNGKAERFIQTALREWACARSYCCSQQRSAHWLPWLHHHNWHRPHVAIACRPPFSGLLLPLNNFLRLHS